MFYNNRLIAILFTFLYYIIMSIGICVFSYTVHYIIGNSIEYYIDIYINYMHTQLYVWTNHIYDFITSKYETIFQFLKEKFMSMWFNNMPTPNWENGDSNFYSMSNFFGAFNEKRDLTKKKKYQNDMLKFYKDFDWFFNRFEEYRSTKTIAGFFDPFRNVNRLYNMSPREVNAFISLVLDSHIRSKNIILQ